MRIEDLSIAAAEIPAGRSQTESELDQSERALLKLLGSYQRERLEQDLRLLLQAQAQKRVEVVDGEAYVNPATLHNDLMQPAELYRMIDAAENLGRYLSARIVHRLERLASAGDMEAAAELESLR